MPADKLLEILGGFGARVVSSHLRPIDEKTLPGIIAYHGKIGNKYIGQSADFFPDYDTLMKRCEYYNRMGKALAPHGMKFLYHNHYHEFQKLQDKYVLYHIMENTDPQYVDFELDTFWAMRGGADPVEVIRHLDSRMKLVHQKDFSKTTNSPINIFSVKDPTVPMAGRTWRRAQAGGFLRGGHGHHAHSGYFGRGQRSGRGVRHFGAGLHPAAPHGEHSGEHGQLPQIQRH